MKAFSHLMSQLLSTFRDAHHQGLVVTGDEVKSLIDIFAAVWVVTNFEKLAHEQDSFMRDYKDITLSLRLPGYDTTDPMVCVKRYRESISGITPPMKLRSNGVASYAFAVIRVIELLYQRYDLQGGADMIVQRYLPDLTAMLLKEREPGREQNALCASS